ncbi:MAG: serine/threonine-protein kinase, partial [Dermatophilaceae bacterium]
MIDTGSTSGKRGLFGRFEVRRQLGRGGFAEVYLAIDPALDTEVALKVLTAERASDPDVRERFIREARLLRRLAPTSNGRLLAVHDLGEQDGRPYLVLEYLPLGSLADRISARHPDAGEVTGREIATLVEELRICLEPVHEAGLVHRDVKPSNLLLRGPVRAALGTDPRRTGATAATDAGPRDRPLLAEGETLVLADFGIAREVELTALTLAVGTPGLAAPEQLLPGTP